MKERNVNQRSVFRWTTFTKANLKSIYAQITGNGRFMYLINNIVSKTFKSATFLKSKITTNLILLDKIVSAVLFYT